MIRARPAARHHQTEDEMEDSIIRLDESGGVQPVRISGLTIARPRQGVGGPGAIVPRRGRQGTMPRSPACQNGLLPG